MRRSAILVLGALAAIALGLLLLELRLRTASAPLPPPEAGGAASFRVLTLGDSITRGIDAEGGSYPRELQPLLWRAKVKGQVEVINGGVAGLETFDLSRRIDELLALHRPQVVITMIGNADTTLPERAWMNHIRVLRLFFLGFDAWKRKRAQGSGPSVRSLGDDTDYNRSFGAVLRGEKKYKEAIRAHLEVLKKDPRHQMAHIELGQICKEMGKTELAESYFRKAIALGADSRDPLKKYSWAYVLLLLLFEDTRQWEKADAVAAEIEKGFPPAYTPYDFLAEHAKKRGRASERDRLLEAGVKGKPGSARLHQLWSSRLEELGRIEEAKGFAVRAAQLESSGPLAEVTRQSYRVISERIRASGALHLAMQYPRRELGPLKELLGEERPNLRYVDNGPAFAAAMEKRKYSDFFIDDFGGTFGHMKPEANRLVAENVMAALLPWLKENNLLE